LLRFFTSSAPSSLSVQGFFREATPKATRIIHVPKMARVPPSSGVIYLARSFQLIVSLLTWPYPPAAVLLQMLYFCLNFWSQPLEATKSEISNFSAINTASSRTIDPETGMLGFLYIVNQSHTAWFTSEYLDERLFYAWFGISLLVLASMMASLFFSIAWICVLPFPKWSANFLDPRLGFCFANSRTLTFSECQGIYASFGKLQSTFLSRLSFSIAPFYVADCSSTQGLSFESVHGVHIDTASPGSHSGSSSEVATEQLFDLLQTGLAQCKHLKLVHWSQIWQTSLKRGLQSVAIIESYCYTMTGQIDCNLIKETIAHLFIHYLTWLERHGKS